MISPGNILHSDEKLAKIFKSGLKLTIIWCSPDARVPGSVVDGGHYRFRLGEEGLNGYNSQYEHEDFDYGLRHFLTEVYEEIFDGEWNGNGTRGFRETADLYLNPWFWLGSKLISIRVRTYLYGPIFWASSGGYYGGYYVSRGKLLAKPR